MFALNAFWQINSQYVGYGAHHSHQEPVNTTGQDVSFLFIIKHMDYKNHLLPLLGPHLCGCVDRV